MNKNENLITELEKFKRRLYDDVIKGYKEKGSSFGDERFLKWKETFSKFLNTHLLNESRNLDNKLDSWGFITVIGGESPEKQFWRENGEQCFAFIDSLMLDISNNEYVSNKSPMISLTIFPPVIKWIAGIGSLLLYGFSHLSNAITISSGWDGFWNNRLVASLKKQW